MGSASTEPLRILSLDGGGIRGLSSLGILEDIMEKIRVVKGLKHVPRPCEHFDLIGGTSTGGIIAIMLGRLQMTVDECIRAYTTVAQQAFIPKKSWIIPGKPSGKFSAAALEKVIKQIVREFCVEEECASRRRKGEDTAKTCPHDDLAFRDAACTKTVILAITKDNIDAPPTLFKTYDTSAAFDKCSIWQVARATSAATTFFKSIKVGRDKIEFVDAGFGYNNPCEVLIQEGQQQFPERGRLQVLSIGTGYGNVVTIEDTRMSILSALKRMASSSKKVAANLSRDNRYGDSGQYDRFIVEQGLENIELSDWQMASTISAHTLNYLSEKQRAIQKFVDRFTGVAQTGEGSGNDSNQHLIYHIIPLEVNFMFIGRETTLDLVEKKLFVEKQKRAAILGLGGVGKTQIALKFAYWVKETRPEHSIFWVSAWSQAAFETSCAKIVRNLGIRKSSDDESPMELVYQHLSEVFTGPWLLIVDDVDDMELLFGSPEAPGGISRFFPENEGCLTLYTTRSEEVAKAVADRNIIEVGEMSQKEATGFLKEALDNKALLPNPSQTEELLEELCYLPLAISHAVAYLNKMQLSVTEYLEQLRGVDSDMIKVLSEPFFDIRLRREIRHKGLRDSVATTFIVSFNKIRHSENTLKILSFVSCIEPKAIPRSLLPVSESEATIKKAIDTLLDYAFVVIHTDGSAFDMHGLVHLATRIWLQKEGKAVRAMELGTCHFQTVFPIRCHSNRTLWRSYLPHALRLLQRSEGSDIKSRHELYRKVGECLYDDGRLKEAAKYFEQCDQLLQDLPEEHQLRRLSEYNRAKTYLDNGGVEKAVETFEHLVAAEEKIHPADHPSLLTSRHGLAMAYRRNGQLKSAVKILEQVVLIRKQTLPETDHDLLASQHELARAYRADDQLKPALHLLEHVVRVREAILPSDHPHLLVSTHELARAYRADGKLTKALPMFKHVVDTTAKSFSFDYPHLLTSQHELAGAYRQNGQIDEAIELLEHVVEVREKLPEGHYDRLLSEHGLAMAYRQKGRTKEAIRLLEHVTTVEKKLGYDDISRLASRHGLAMAYRADGQVQKAIRIQEQVFGIGSQSYGESHTSRLTFGYELAQAYEANGQLDEATLLLEHVVQVRARIFQEDHPDRLKSESALARVRLAKRGFERANLI